MFPANVLTKAVTYQPAFKSSLVQYNPNVGVTFTNHNDERPSPISTHPCNLLNVNAD